MIAAVAAAVTLATPSREALVQRWRDANRTHTIARLQSRPAAGPLPDQTPNLQALAQRELTTAGRYQLRLKAAPPEEAPWWARLWDWIADKWGRLWNSLFSRVHLSREATAAIGDALLVLVGVLLIVVVARVLRNVQIARTGARARSEPLAASVDPTLLYRDAREAANLGDYGSAALLLFAATVALLEGRGVIDARRSATVGDFRRGLRIQHAASIASFDAVAAPFVQRAYAERPVDAGQWARAEAGFIALCH